jgi:membrane protein implicated in regulation of membrane protease activity
MPAASTSWLAEEANMDFSTTTIWWVLAGVAVAVELATGTFYLLMLALGLAAGAIASHMGFSGPLQVAAAAAVGGGATGFWYWRRAREAPTLPAASNRDVNLDIGERVFVQEWAANGTAQVQYRGSPWEARLAPGAPAAAGEHVVSAVEGNWLVLEPAAPRQ